MHINTRVRPEYIKRAAKFSSEDDLFGAGMLELDEQVGKLLAELDRLGQTKNTIVIFTSDNGPMSAWWPDGGTTPFHGEKASSWEGAYRVPTLIRWPGKIPAGSVSNGLQSHMDLFSTLTAAAGVDNVAAKLLESHKVKIDGVNNLQHWTDLESKTPSARESYIYYVESNIVGIRWNYWKTVSKERNGFFDYYREGFNMFNLRMDPYERHVGAKNNEFTMKKAWVGGVFRDIITDHLISLKQFPPRQAGGSLRGGMENTK
jgi:arylsulfatase